MEPGEAPAYPPVRGFFIVGYDRLCGSCMTETCTECKQQLLEIDNRGQHLCGCLTCNIWWSDDEEKVRLSEEDLAALHALRMK